MPDFALSFDFDNHERSLGADQKIDLASFVALRFVLQIGGRGKHKRPLEPKMREQVVHMVENEILKLQPQNGIPSVLQVSSFIDSSGAIHGPPQAE